MVIAATPGEAHDRIAADMADLTGLPVTAIPGGFRVKETATHWVDVIRQIFNWRVTCTPKDRPFMYDRHWCYDGADWAALIITLLAVADWDGGQDTEPDGWLKNGQTEEVRRDGAR